MSSENIHVPINTPILVVVEEIKDYLEARLLPYVLNIYK